MVLRHRVIVVWVVIEGTEPNVGESYYEHELDVIGHIWEE